LSVTRRHTCIRMWIDLSRNRAQRANATQKRRSASPGATLSFCNPIEERFDNVSEIAPDSGLPLSKCEAYNRVSMTNSTESR